MAIERSEIFIRVHAITSFVCYALRSDRLPEKPKKQ
jgi:hypothetical protein